MTLILRLERPDGTVKLLIKQIGSFYKSSLRENQESSNQFSYIN